MFKKILYRLFLPLVVFSFLIYFKRCPIFSISNFGSFLNEFLNGRILGSYWFIYVLMGLYLATPFLQKMCKNLDKHDYKIILIYSVIVMSLLPIFKHYAIFSITSDFSIPLISSYVTYYLLGNYFFNYDIKISSKKEKILLISAIIILIFGTIMTYYDFNNLKYTEFFYGTISRITVLIPTICIVYFCRKYFEKNNFSSDNEKKIILVSSTTFGIYLIHAFFIGNTDFIYNFLTNTLKIW